MLHDYTKQKYNTLYCVTGVNRQHIDKKEDTYISISVNNK